MGGSIVLWVLEVIKEVCEIIFFFFIRLLHKGDFSSDPVISSVWIVKQKVENWCINGVGNGYDLFL